MLDQDIKDRGEDKTPPRRRLNPEEPFPWVTLTGVGIGLLGAAAAFVRFIIEAIK